MWCNQAKCDIYIGSGAGTKLLKEMRSARSSIKIASPYVSRALMEELIALHRSGLEVHLITTLGSQEGDERQLQSIRPLLFRRRHLSKKNSTCRRIYNMAAIASLVGAIIALGLILKHYLLMATNLSLPLLLLPLLLFWIFTVFRKKAGIKSRYSYSYHSHFKLRIFSNYNLGGRPATFIHGKIYIIDGKVAYLGSLNFTDRGTRYNYETRIRVQDKEAVTLITQEYDSLFHCSLGHQPDLADYGKRLFGEPIIG